MTSKRLRQLISMVLVVCLCFALAAPAMAAGGFGSRSRSIWGGCMGNTSGQDETTEDDSTLTTIEDATTVENGDALRASTYVLSDASGNSGVSTADVGSTTLKYFKATMYDYDADTINNATHQAEIDEAGGAENLSGYWNGIYFSAGNPADSAYEYTTSANVHTNLTWANVINGTYYYDEACSIKVSVTAVTENGEASDSYQSTNISYNNNNNYSSYCNNGYYYYYDGNYELITNITCYRYGYGATYWTVTTSGGSRSDSGSTLTIYKKTTSAAAIGYTMTAGGSTIASLDGTNTGTAVGITLYSKGSTGTTLSKIYADWNWWRKGKTKTDNYPGGAQFYTGLVEDELDANKNIVFTKPEGGIFNNDETVKSIYNNVEIPYVYNDTTGYYTFDAAKYGVFFHEDAAQGSSGTPASNTRMYFASGNTQTFSDETNFGTVWAPYDDTTKKNIYSWGMNYHFGMSTTIPFTMTSNGKINAADDGSDDITFTFAGDDDVWVFIDGQLVIDLGGIHDELQATINFADNTVSYSYVGTSYTTGSCNDSTFKNDQTLFGNLISQDRTTFAATDQHELTIYYLERGEGDSNCKIEFNLPVKDSVSVTKHIGGAVSVDENGTLTTTAWDNLSTSQKAVLNNQEFTFTLYKNGTPVANATYLRLDKDNQAVATASTDANGQFILKNNETAKFTMQFNGTDGDEYYVVENIKDGFIYTTFSESHYSAGSVTTANTENSSYQYYTKSADGVHYVTDKTLSDGTLESQTVRIVGGDESEDSLTFICTNYMNASLPTPSVIANDETIVIDYGLSVDIEIASNNLVLGDRSEITFPGYTENNGVYTAEYGTFTYNGKDTITYTLKTQLTGIETIDYLVTSYASAGDGTEVSATDTATVTIIPATSMYYEENFGFVSYINGKSTSGWLAVGTPENDKQEPGVVGTVGDSPYGSDVAYLSDSHDSNGSSMYVDTTNGAAQFSYRFTGTGTTFFARTSGDSGYMRVQVKDADGTLVDTWYRDTSYKDANGDLVDLANANGAVDAAATVLYNIPVFTVNDLAYGEYEVTVTVAKKVTAGSGKLQYGDQFWLDGIRVIDPLGTARDDEYIGADELADVKAARSAYSTDGEANMTVATLRTKILADSTTIVGDDENGKLIWTEDFVVFTDTNGEIVDASEYKSNGPKEEVYLNAGQSISFSLYDWDPNNNKLYLGMKAPTGSSTVTIGNKEFTLNNAADCYYEISNYGKIDTNDDGTKIVTFTITAGADSLISVTNIKVTGSAEFVIVGTQGDINVDGDVGVA